MASDRGYDIEEMARIIASASGLFDVVRLVDPIDMTVFTIENGKLVAQPGGCHQVWGKEDRCDNCISAKCFMDERRFSKFEFIDHDIYHVVAQPVVVDGRRFVLEVVTSSNDDVLLSAFGNNDFVDRITSFNRKVYSDELTGLSNRRCMDDHLAIMAESVARDHAPLAVVMVDCDDFKHVNDTLGHLAGDEVLKTVAHALDEGFAPSPEDIVARYGGDEFFAVLRDVSAAELVHRIDDVRRLVAQSGAGVTISVGAYYQAAAIRQTPEKLIRKADEAMYAVKSTTKDGFTIRR